MNSDPPVLPAVQWLGYALDMSAVTPFDIEMVSHSVLKADPVLPIPLDGARKMTINGTTYLVPRNVLVDQTTRTLDAKFVTYKNGDDAAVDFFKPGSDASSRYLAIYSTGDSGSYPLQKSLLDSNQYAFFGFNATLSLADLTKYISLLNEDELKEKVEVLPFPFDAKNKDHVKKYRAFFSSVGTHVIVGTTYGARYQLSVWAANSHPSVNDNFGRDVTAAYHGITNSGKYDASVYTEVQYEIFGALQQHLVSIVGGDATLTADLLRDPTDYSTYLAWTRSTLTNPDLMGFRTTPIWLLFKDADDDTLVKYANQIQNAFLSIKPEPVQTTVSFHIDAYWAEFGLLTPSAKVSAYPDEASTQTSTEVDQTPDNVFIQNNTKVRLGSEQNKQRIRATIEFLIINDGSPIDFYISHGKGIGADITILDVKYVNNGVTDRAFNTKWYSSVPVTKDTPPPCPDD